MKAFSRKPSIVALLCLGVGFAPLLGASDPAQREEQRLPRSTALAKLYPYGQRASDILGMNVRGSSGENLGQINDLVVDALTGRVVYAAVSTGGLLGLGDTLRAVPFSALNYTSDRREALTLNVSTADWKAAPTFLREELPTLSVAPRGEETFRYYGQNWADVTVSPRATTTSPDAAMGPDLRFARELAGSDVRAGDQRIGNAEDLIVNVAQRNAAVLLDPEDHFSGTSDKYVIPFSQLSARTQTSDTLATTLTATDLTSAKPLDDKWSKNPDGVFLWNPGSPAPARK